MAATRWERRLRLYTGLVIVLWVVPHVANHALGLASLQVMEQWSFVWLPLIQHPPWHALLFGCFLTHIGLALWSLWRRTSLALPAWEWAQLGLGLMVPFVLIQHVMHTRGAIWFGAPGVAYEGVIASQWLEHWSGAPLQAAFLAFVWLHMSIGLHYWQRHRAWYRRCRPFALVIVVLLPCLGLLGYARAGWEVTVKAAADPGYRAAMHARMQPRDPADARAHTQTVHAMLATYTGALALVLLARLVRQAIRQRRGIVRVGYPDGRSVRRPVGASLLEFSRSARIPHAAMCGGRARCTTCRVRVGDGLDDLPEASPLERDALTRIGAEPNVRLACQTRPTADCEITPLVPADHGFTALWTTGGGTGREIPVAVLFLDLRGSTALAENRLPYDVVFILNQFFAQMSDAVEQAGGHYSNFTGDGLMALFGHDGRDGAGRAGVRQAIAAAIDMLERLDRLNDRLRGELGQDLAMGIGVHAGLAIVGTMGPPKTPVLSALGDTVNTAARLESLCKPFGVPLVVSEAAAKAGVLDLSLFPRHVAEAKGKSESVPLYALPWPDAQRLKPLVTRSTPGRGVPARAPAPARPA